MKKILIALACITLAGCANKPVQRETGIVNFSYTPTSSSQKTDKIIAIVSPSISSKAGAGFSQVKASNNLQNVNLLLLASRRHNRSNVDFARILSNYSPRLTSSMESGFNELIISKGFTISGPYQTFDDITYSDKKASYLALVPDLNIFIDKKAEKITCSSTNGYCEDFGTIQVGGFLNIKLIEPLTKQTFFSKRINLSKLTAQREYVKREAYRDPSTGLVGMAFNSLAADKKPLIDNTDKALVDVLNEFYSKAMKKVDEYISTEEVMSFEKDVIAIKNLKRF